MTEQKSNIDKNKSHKGFLSLGLLGMGLLAIMLFFILISLDMSWQVAVRRSVLTWIILLIVYYSMLFIIGIIRGSEDKSDEINNNEVNNELQ